MRTHYRFVQVVEVITRGQDKICMDQYGRGIGAYTSPVSGVIISELGISDNINIGWYCWNQNVINHLIQEN